MNRSLRQRLRGASQPIDEAAVAKLRASRVRDPAESLRTYVERLAPTFTTIRKDVLEALVEWVNDRDEDRMSSDSTRLAEEFAAHSGYASFTNPIEHVVSTTHAAPAAQPSPLAVAIDFNVVFIGGSMHGQDVSIREQSVNVLGRMVGDPEDDSRYEEVYYNTQVTFRGAMRTYYVSEEIYTRGGTLSAVQRYEAARDIARDVYPIYYIGGSRHDTVVTGELPAQEQITLMNRNGEREIYDWVTREERVFFVISDCVGPSREGAVSSFIANHRLRILAGTMPGTMSGPEPRNGTSPPDNTWNIGNWSAVNIEMAPANPGISPRRRAAMEAARSQVDGAAARPHALYLGGYLHGCVVESTDVMAEVVTHRGPAGRGCWRRYVSESGLRELFFIQAPPEPLVGWNEACVRAWRSRRVDNSQQGMRFFGTNATLFIGRDLPSLPSVPLEIVNQRSETAVYRHSGGMSTTFIRTACPGGRVYYIDRDMSSQAAEDVIRTHERSIGILDVDDTRMEGVPTARSVVVFIGGRSHGNPVREEQWNSTSIVDVHSIPAPRSPGVIRHSQTYHRYVHSRPQGTPRGTTVEHRIFFVHEGISDPERAELIRIYLEEREPPAMQVEDFTVTTADGRTRNFGSGTMTITPMPAMDVDVLPSVERDRRGIQRAHALGIYTPIFVGGLNDQQVVDIARRSQDQIFVAYPEQARTFVQRVGDTLGRLRPAPIPDSQQECYDRRSIENRDYFVRSGLSQDLAIFVIASYYRRSAQSSEITAQ